MRTFLYAAVGATLAGCVALPASPPMEAVLADDRFDEPVVPVSEHSIFSVSDEMRAFISGTFADDVGRIGGKAALIHALNDELRLIYDAGDTRTASEAFATRSGNCLSLVILAASLAREMGMTVFFQSVSGYEAWTREGNLAFRSGHVNLRLDQLERLGWGESPSRYSSTIDFTPPPAGARWRSRPIGENVVVAMYLNNRAAELLAAGDESSAYWWARTAIHRAPEFTPAYNTLGVIHTRHGNEVEAENSFRFVLLREPEDPGALGNLIRSLNRSGRVAEADELRQRLVQIEPFPPYFFLDQGLAALRRGAAAEALELLEKEQQRMPHEHEVQFALAIASVQLGKLEEARRYLGRAAEFSGTRDRRQIYEAKLRHLRQARNRQAGSGAGGMN